MAAALLACLVRSLFLYLLAALGLARLPAGFIQLKFANHTSNRAQLVFTVDDLETFGESRFAPVRA